MSKWTEFLKSLESEGAATFLLALFLVISIVVVFAVPVTAEKQEIANNLLSGFLGAFMTWLKFRDSAGPSNPAH